MTAQANGSAPPKPLRLWPGVVLVVLQWLGWWVIPNAAPELVLYGVLGALLAGPAIAVWWVFLSRAPRIERWGAATLVIAAIAVTRAFLHESVAKGNMGFQFFLWAIPVLCLAFVAWAVASRGLAAGPRLLSMVVTVVLACGAFTLLRSKGVTGDGMAEFTWRWTETAEERLLARTHAESRFPAPAPREPAVAESPAPAPHASGEGRPVAAEVSPPVEAEASPEAPAAAPAVPAATAEWPGLRGPQRDGVLPGLRIETDWSASPPIELWRRPIGPGVSSFAVSGNRLYTQEQRGDDEIVAAHHVSSGEPVWMHRDTARFWDSHVGAGPRATPALGHGRVYALGATGILNALDGDDGSVVWARDLSADSKPPLWGFVSSPLVVDDLVVVHAGKLVAYDAATGQPRWFGPAGGSYGSPHLLTLQGVPQILLLTHDGVTSVAPADGTRLWEHAWPGIGITQPVLTAEGDILFSMIDTGAAPIGTRRIRVTNGPEGWSTEERWTSTGLKPSFSPLVVHEGHAYGFDGRLVACIDVETGERKWKGGRYGSGQLMLLPDQDLLLIVSEQGELALVRASPDQFTELARFPAIEGKTWSQPAVVGDVLLVRNGQEMAAFRLPLAASAGGS